MAIVISRATGETVSVPELTQQQKDELWGAIVGAYLKKHPELLEAEGKKCTSSA